MAMPLCSDLSLNTIESNVAAPPRQSLSIDTSKLFLLCAGGWAVEGVAEGAARAHHRLAPVWCCAADTAAAHISGASEQPAEDTEAGGWQEVWTPAWLLPCSPGVGEPDVSQEHLLSLEQAALLQAAGR